MAGPSDSLFGRFKLSKLSKPLVSDDQKVIKNTAKTDFKKFRNRGGCFCCRKRKIKCDEVKPSCGNCEKSSYVCVWPRGKESLPHKSDFKLTKLKEKKLRFVKANLKCPNTITEEVFVCPDTFSDNPELIEFDDESSTSKLGAPYDEERENSSVTDRIIELGSTLSPISALLTNDENCTSSPDSFSDFALDDEVISTNSEAKKIMVTLETINKANRKEIIQDAMYRKYLRELVIPDSISGYNTWLPGVSLTRVDAFLYSAFINGFMVSISPQIAHINLQPGSVFVPPGIHNPILRSLFFACGASFLCQPSMTNENVAELAITKCDEAIMKIQKFIEVNPITGNEDWVIIFLLLFCLKQKFVFEGSKSQTLNMISALETVRLWLMTKKTKNDSGNDFGKITKIEDLDNEVFLPGDKSVSSFQSQENNDIDWCEIYESDSNDNTDLESSRVFNKLITKMKPLLSKRAKSTVISKTFSSLVLDVTNIELEVLMPMEATNVNVKIHSYERTIIESFVYNYSNTLFICDRSLLSYLASPFDLFEDLKPFLLQPLYNCIVPWMNNPVVGAALTSIELQAKINWLSLHYPLSPENRRLAITVRKTAKYYAHPILPTEIRAREPESVQQKLMESCYVADIISKGVFILATKLLYPETLASDPGIQEAVEAADKDLHKMSFHSQASAITAWGFAIVASAMIHKEQKEYLVWRVQNFADALKMKSFRTVIDFAECVWGTEENPGPGLDAVLDPEYINLLIM